MNIEISEAPIGSVAELGRIAISFTVDREYDVAPNQGSAPFLLSERVVRVPYVKDYDRIPGEGPLSWARRFPISRWGFMRAMSGGRFVGGAVIALDSDDAAMFDRRQDLGVVWDIRVAPDVRGRGIGSELLRSSERWAVSNGCRHVKVETQNINVPACRLYQRNGFTLEAANRHAYPEFPGEIQLLWYKDVTNVR